MSSSLSDDITISMFGGEKRRRFSRKLFGLGGVASGWGKSVEEDLSAEGLGGEFRVGQRWERGKCTRLARARMDWSAEGVW